MKPILQQLQQEAKNIKPEMKPAINKELEKKINIAQSTVDKARILIEQVTGLTLDKCDLMKHYKNSNLS